MGADGQPPVAQVVPAEAPKRWPAAVALLTAWLLPATTARRTEHVSLWRAFAVHLVAMMLLPISAFLPAIWWDVRFEDESLTTAVADFFEQTADLFAEEPVIVCVFMVLNLFFVEVLVLLTGVTIWPWGALDEPLSASIRNGVRRVWLQTLHWWLASTAAMVVTMEIMHAVGEIRSASFGYEPSGAGARGWLVRQGDNLIGAVWLAVTVWLAWALLRAVGARQPRPPVNRPPTCEFCGYNLTGTRMDGRCPECGQLVADSLGAEVRPGAPWQRRRELGRRRALWRSWVDPILRPGQFGRQLQLSPGSQDHRGFLAMHLPAVFLAAAMVTVACMAASRGWRFIESELADVVWLAGLMGCLAAGALVGLPIMAAGLAGLRLAISHKRNVTSAAMQAACYLSGFAVVWVLAAGFELAGMLWQADQIDRLVAPIDRSIWIALSCVVLNLLVGVLYLVLVSRAARNACYANK